MIETAELQERRAAREEAEKAHAFAEKIRRHFADAEPSSCASWMLERAEQEEYDALSRLIELADQRGDRSAQMTANDILTGLALTTASWVVILCSAIAAGKWA